MNKQFGTHDLQGFGLQDYPLAIGAAEKVIHDKLDDQQHRKLIEQYIDELGELPNA